MSPRTLEATKKNVAHAVYEGFIEQMTDPSVPWEDVAVSMHEFVNKFPDRSRHLQDLAVMALLDRMAKEERDHAQVVSRRRGPQSLKNRIPELIWQLRNVGMFSQNPQSDALRKLMKIGLPAVPQLIEALHDRRFTRTTFGGGRTGAWYPLDEASVERVGDLAEMAIREIAHQDFGRFGDTDRVEKAAKAWYVAHKPSRN